MSPVAPERGLAQLNLLGRFEYTDARGAVHLPGGMQRLTAFLALHHTPTARDVVAASLWPDVAAGPAHASLRSTLWRLRQRSPALVRCDGELLALGGSVRVDHVAEGRTAMRLCRPDAAFSREELERVDLTGELLPGWPEDWLIVERERMRQLQLHGLEATARRLSELGCYAGAVDVALHVIGREPLRESSYRTLTEIHLREGNVAEAIRLFRKYTRLVRVELEVVPSPRFTEIMRPFLREVTPR